MSNVLMASEGLVSGHANLTNNPHGVTKTQVGLGSVDNTSDVDKPVSTATANAIATAVKTAVKTSAQTLTDNEKSQARENIGAASSAALDAEAARAAAAEAANESSIAEEALRAGAAEGTLYQNISTHTGNGDIHVTAEQKSAWSAKQDAIAAFLKDAVVNGGVLTITKKDGTTVQFQGGSSAWADITGKPQSFTPSAHTHTKSDVTDFGGPYLPTSGGELTSSSSSEVGITLKGGVGEFYSGGDAEVKSGSEGNPASIVLNGGVFRGAILEVKEADDPTHPLSEKASIKKGGKEVATEDQLPYASTSTPADRTCATVTVASTGASVTIPKPSTANKVTAFCVYLDMTALTGTAPTVGYKYSDNTDPVMLTRGGETLSYETGAINAVFFIQVGTGYIVSAQTYKEPSNG